MTTDRHSPDATQTHQDEFWGEQTEWTPQRRPSPERRGLGSTIGRWWDGLLGGSAGAEHAGDDGHRAHGRSRAPGAPIDRSEDRPHTDLGHDGAIIVDDAPVDAGDDVWTFEPERPPVRRLGVDPLLTRLGGLAVIVTLAAPLLLGFTSSGSDSQSTDSFGTIAGVGSVESAAPATTPSTDIAEAASAAATPAPATPVSAQFSPTAPSSAPDVIVATAAVSAPADTASLDAAPEPATTEPATTSPATSEPATTAPAVTAPACGKQYELVAGDYWIRIADAADVSLADLLAVNGSSVDTMLVPGRSVCLPMGSSTPSSPPAATAPATTSPPTTAALARSAPTTTTTTTAAASPTPPVVAPAPTPPAPARPAAVPSLQAIAIIRQMWPDDLEEHAIEIARRESNHKSNVNNFCCYGLFQIYYSVHKSWLSTIGVNSAQDLFDPQLNAQAAYILYQRAGGFGPWGG